MTTEWLTEYKGEYGERLLVHTYQMMNYLLIGKHEDALVEAKQALEIYGKYPSCSNDYFTRALIAHCYEALGEINDAYIEYKKLSQIMNICKTPSEKVTIIIFVTPSKITQCDLLV